MPYIKNKSGLKWHYIVKGEGDLLPLLFVHGWGVDARLWRQQIKYFSQSRKVIAIDLPGHGKSEWVKKSFDDLVNGLVDIVNEILPHNFLLVGSSLGGMVGIKLFDLLPGRVSKIILVGSLPKFCCSEDFPFGLNVDRIRKLNGQLSTSYPSIVNIFFRSLFTKEERASRRVKWIQKFKRNDPIPMREALSDYLDVLENEDVRCILKKLNIPVQFINGTGDQICTINAVEEIKKMLPQARYDYFQDCGHFPFLSQPHVFNNVLHDFISKV